MLCKYPPMGWNSWDCYGTAVTEAVVRQNADYMAKRLKPFGWEYVVVDIQWYQPTALDHGYEPFSNVAMAGFGRMAFAYPDFARDLKEKGEMDARKVCVACGGCAALLRRGTPAGCVVRDREAYRP